MALENNMGSVFNNTQPRAEFLVRNFAGNIGLSEQEKSVLLQYAKNNIEDNLGVNIKRFSDKNDVQNFCRSCIENGHSSDKPGELQQLNNLFSE